MVAGKLRRHSNDKSSIFLGLLLLLCREHEQRFAVTELALLRRDRRIRFPDADQVLLRELEGGDFIRRHDIEVNATALAVDPSIVDVNRVRGHDSSFQRTTNMTKSPRIIR